MKKIILITLSAVLGFQANAAKFEAREKLEKLDLVQELGNEFCATMVENNLECFTSSYVILSKKPSEKYENSIKQILHSSKYVENVTSRLLSKSNGAKEVFDALNDVAEAVDYFDNPGEGSELALDALHERLENDVDNSTYQFFAGAVEGAFSSSFSYLAVLHVPSGELVILNAGYAE